MREKIFLACVNFRAVREIRSLPPYHGARWAAWFRFACKHAGLEAETAFLGLYPLRNGQDPVLRGDVLTVRLVLDLEGCRSLPALLASLAQMEARGEFSGASLEPCSCVVKPLDEAAVAGQVERLCACQNWRMDFASPLRLPLPHPHKRLDPGLGMFCQADFFSPANSGQALSHLLGRIRWYRRDDQEKPVDTAGIRIERSSLVWRDMRYSRQRGIALGGLAGRLECSGQPGPELAKLLVLGQYAGAGKNARFGLGYWLVSGPEMAE